MKFSVVCALFAAYDTNEVSTSLFCTYILALCLMVHSAQSKMGTTSIERHSYILLIVFLMPHCPVTVVQRYRDGVCSLLFHLFFIICHPYIPLHLEEMIFYTCIYRLDDGSEVYTGNQKPEGRMSASRAQRGRYRPRGFLISRIIHRGVHRLTYIYHGNASIASFQIHSHSRAAMAFAPFYAPGAEIKYARART